ncbi:hypothetical protein, partial [Kitasatospora sp. LaBMicrA B282]|uniref:hypothetical protein n=1 Tax=Kitasatospora sp. LaBMicrA B282 TaxID=3420949 RepID=UPI003D151B79
QPAELPAVEASRPAAAAEPAGAPVAATAPVAAGQPTAMGELSAADREILGSGGATALGSRGSDRH